MRFFRVSGFALFAVVVAAQSAFARPDPSMGEAEPPPPPPDPTGSAAPPPPPPPPPSGASDVAAPAAKTSGTILPNMLPSRIGATIDVRVDYSHFSEGFLGGGDLFLLGFNLHGQYIAPQGYGGYLTIPYFYARIEDDGIDGPETQSENGAGNLELGGLYRLPQSETTEILLRGGFALDTAGNVGGFLTPFSQLAPRLYDAYPTGFAATWLKAEASLRHSSGNLVLAASGGFDVPLGQDDGEGTLTVNVDAVAKAAISAGIENPGFGLSAGFVFLAAIGTNDDDNETVMGLNLLANFPINAATALYATFGLPDLEDNADEFDLWAVGAGVRAAIN